jgi:hypothetical protein
VKKIVNKIIAWIIVLVILLVICLFGTILSGCIMYEWVVQKSYHTPTEWAARLTVAILCFVGMSANIASIIAISRESGE